jgi:cell division protein FtsB
MSALRQLSNPVRTPAPSRARPAAKPTRRSKTTPQRRQQQQQVRHRVLAIETSLKITVNMMIAGVAVTTLFNVIPNRVSQQQKLQELKAEVNVTEQRVNQLKTDFNRAFDPGQERQIAQEQTHFADPNRVPVVWLNRKNQATAQLPEN